MSTAHRSIVESARRSHALLLPDRARRLAKGAVSNGRGGTRSGWAETAWPWPAWLDSADDRGDGTLPARVARPTAAEARLVADTFGTIPTRIVTLPWGAAIAVGDQLDLGLELVDPLRVQVVADLTEAASFTTATRLACVEADA